MPMPDNKKTITWRSEAYSDVADSPPFRKHVVQQTEDAFARLLLRAVRERARPGGAAGRRAPRRHAPVLEAHGRLPGDQRSDARAERPPPPAGPPEGPPRCPARSL